MTYELAKQLKDAGFPEMKSWDYRTPNNKDDWDICVSALIRECGDSFYSLVRKKSGDTFYASNGGDWILPGQTPEEAVARLWLAINGSVNEQSE